jgi:hypothetical protein
MVDLSNAYCMFESYHQGNCLLVALNLSDAPVARLVSPGYGIIAGGGTFTGGSPGEASIRLAPFGWAIMECPTQGASR